MIDVKKEFAKYQGAFNLYESYLARLRRLITELLEARHIQVHKIEGRCKEFSSLEEKLTHNQSKYNRLEDVTDLVGIRVITYFSKDVERVAGIISGELVIDHTNSVDKADSLNPDQFGYLSVHYIIELDSDRTARTEYRQFRDLKAEIQVRSLLQHAWAEIEHDLGYKNTAGLPVRLRRKMARIAGLLEIADEEFDIVKKDASTPVDPSVLPIVRAEGIAELLPDFEVQVPYSVLSSTGDNYDLILVFNTNVTNELLDGGTATHAQLRIDAGRNRGRMFRGELWNHSLRFRDLFRVPRYPRNDYVSITFTQIRVNAAAFRISSMLRTTVQATLFAQPSSDSEGSTRADSLPLESAVTVEVCQIWPGYRSRVLDSTGHNATECFSISAGRIVNSADIDSSEPMLYLEFEETFAGSFTNRSGEAGDASLEGRCQGTRFWTSFRKIPDGVSIYVTSSSWVADLGGSDTLPVHTGATAQIVHNADPNGNDGHFAENAGNTSRWIKLEDQSGSKSAFATWEWIGQVDLSRPRVVRFGLALAQESPGIPKAGECTVAMSLGPLSTITTASPRSSLPRFIPVSKPFPIFRVVADSS